MPSNSHEENWQQNRDAHDEFERQLKDVQAQQRSDRVHLDELDSANRETHTALLRHLLDELKAVRDELKQNTEDTRDLKLMVERGRVGLRVIIWLLGGIASMVTAGIWAVEKWQQHIGGNGP